MTEFTSLICPNCGGTLNAEVGVRALCCSKPPSRIVQQDTHDRFSLQNETPTRVPTTVPSASASRMSKPSSWVSIKSNTAADLGFYEKYILKPGSLPAGRLLGTVEVVACTGSYEWHLA